LGRALSSDENDPEIVRSKLQSLENVRLTLLGRLRAAQSLEANPPGYYQLLAPSHAQRRRQHGRKMKVLFLAAFLGLLAPWVPRPSCCPSRSWMTGSRPRPMSVRVTQLPVLAFAGDLGRMTEAEQKDWAFRAWTNLQAGSVLRPTWPGCGLTSAGHGEGRTTWVNLLARAAAQRGFRVLTVATRPSPHNGETDGPFVETGAGPKTVFLPRMPWRSPPTF